MAYQIRRQEAIEHELRRLAKKELAAARGKLKRTPPDDDAVHEARKSVKKVRAILALVKADRGKAARGDKKRLRTVSHFLSRLRDADAMVEILGKLRQRNPRLLNDRKFARLRRQLSSTKKAALAEARRDGAWKTTSRELRKLRRDAGRWRVRHRRFGALAAGIGLAHRQGRKALARARKRQRAADFHEWRKRMKMLWCHLRLVEGTARGVGRDVVALYHAEHWLGDDHNLVVLCAELSKEPSVCSRIDIDRLHVAADRFQCDLRARAIERTTRIYRQGSAAYVRRLRRAWNASS